MPRGKKKTKKTVAKKKTRKKKAAAVADPVSAEETVEEEAPKKKKPPRRAVVAATSEPEATEPENEDAPQKEEDTEVMTVVEVDLRETIYDLLAKEAQSRQIEPAECAAMLIESALTSTDLEVVGVSLVSEDMVNDVLIEDPEYQDSFEELMRRV